LNVLDKFPKSMQPNAHKDLREIWLAPDRATAEMAIATFAEKYAPKYDKAVECLIKDRETLLTFYAFPDEVRRIIYTTDEMDKRFVSSRVIFFWRGRPRGEERSLGWKLRQAA